MNQRSASKGHHNLRKGRISIPGQVYFITVVCKEREIRFKDFYIAAETSRVLVMPSTWSDAVVLAWVLMPDHYHVLISLGQKVTLQNVMQRANSILAIAVNKVSCRSGQVWQSAYYDRALRSDEHLKTAARYLIANPLRAGLVANIGEYSFWDAIWLSQGYTAIV